YISDSKPGVIGMRHAIKPCFETIHLLADAHAFCMAEIEKYRQLDQVPPFYYVKHANAIIRFTKVFLNRRIPSNCALNIPNIEPLSHDADDAGLSNRQVSWSIEKDPESQSANQRRTLFSNHPFSFEYTPVKKIRLEVENYNDQPKHVTLLTTLLDHTKFHKANHAFVKDLLKADGGCWVPGNTSNLNPLKHAIKMGNRPLVEAIIDYGVKNAKQYHPAYLLPAMQCLKELSVEYPDLVKRMFKMSSYTPAHNHGSLLNHTKIASFRFSDDLDDYKKPVFNLRYKLDVKNKGILNNYKLTKIATFPSSISKSKTKKKSTANQFTHKIFVCPYPTLSTFDIRGKEESAFTSIAGGDFFDNPAMKATLRFKWNRYGSFYNYVDILTYALSMGGAAVFLRSKPTGSADDEGPHQNTPLSYAILCLTLTLLFELRVFKQFGIVVNMIFEITKEVAVFFCVFLMFIIGFTSALQHLLLTRRYYADCDNNPECPGDYKDNKYPRGYIQALIDTFFFLGGRYEPIGDSIDKGTPSLRAMMLIFYLITVILFLNILIAFMNDAYNGCRNQGEVGWLIHLSDVINEVERVMLWKFRRRSGKYFPDYIYYYATEQDAVDYEAEYQISNKSKLSPENRYLYDNMSKKFDDTSKEMRILSNIECSEGEDYESEYNGRSAPMSPTATTHNNSSYNSHQTTTTDEAPSRQRKPPRQTTEGLSQSHQSQNTPRRVYSMEKSEPSVIHNSPVPIPADTETEGLQNID
ncbi:hypothetical protein BGZ76_006529, partial [Entomortierella beljakovae]